MLIFIFCFCIFIAALIYFVAIPEFRMNAEYWAKHGIATVVWISEQIFPPSELAMWPTTFPWCEDFRKEWKTILQEYMDYQKTHNIMDVVKVYPNFDSLNLEKTWFTVNLRVYNQDTDAAALFPKTMAIINKYPRTFTHAMMSVLDPQSTIRPHRGPYRGIFRYHLALIVPEHQKEDMHLRVYPGTSSTLFWQPDEEPDVEPMYHHWEEGKDLIFDDTCVHQVRNYTNKRRVILFLDVVRHDLSWWRQMINYLVMVFVAPRLDDVKIAVDVSNQYVNEPKQEPKDVDDVQETFRLLQEIQALDKKLSSNPALSRHRKKEIDEHL